MSLFAALNTSVSGLSAGSAALRTISNNLANSNTIGYKRERSLFTPLVAAGSTLSGLVGSGGVSTATQRLQSVQGMNQVTENALDVSLAGNGFVPVTDEIGSDGVYYMRSSSFQQNRDGYIVDSASNYLMGWETDGEGNVVPPQTLAPIRINSRISAQATSSLAIGLNLQAIEEENQYNTSVSLQSHLDDILSDPNIADYNLDANVFDAQGIRRNISTAFIKHADNTWAFVSYTDGRNINGGTSGENEQLSSGKLYFNPDGTLKYSTVTTLTADWADGVPEEEISLNFGSATGGFIFDESTITGSLDFTDGIIDILFDSQHLDQPNPALGTYSIDALGANQLQLTEPDGSTWTANVPIDSERRTVLFGNGVSVSVSRDWVYPAVTPASLGTIDTLQVDPVTTTTFDGIVQYASSYNPFVLEQDGFTSGTLNDIQIDEEGFVNGFFTNGKTEKLWRIPVAVFGAPQEMEMMSGNKYRATAASGEPFFKEAGSGDAAKVVAFSLEISTVDVATEFSNMVMSQRVYQANSKVMQTTDAMLSELMNIR